MRDETQEGWHKVSLTVDPGACDTVVDPRAFPGHLLSGSEASKAGDVFLAVAGDPVLQFGEKEVAVCIESGDVRPSKAQCGIVAKPLLSVKIMTEVGQFVGFCSQGGFVLGLGSGVVDWFREGNCNYMLDTWLVPHGGVNDLVDIVNKQGFARPSKCPVWT